MNELFDTSARFGDDQLLKQRAEPHDKRNLARAERFADANRRDQCEQNEHVRFDIERISPTAASVAFGSPQSAIAIHAQSNGSG